MSTMNVAPSPQSATLAMNCLNDLLQQHRHSSVDEECFLEEKTSAGALPNSSTSLMLNLEIRFHSLHHLEIQSRLTSFSIQGAAVDTFMTWFQSNLSNIFHLKCLRKLSLVHFGTHGHGFETLPETMSHLHHLQYLTLQGCGLRSLPLSIGYLVNLEELDVSHNYLQQLPWTLRFCRALKVLDMRHNRFDSLPYFLQNMPSLERAKRFDNPLNDVVGTGTLSDERVNIHHRMPHDRANLPGGETTDRNLPRYTSQGVCSLQTLAMTQFVTQGGKRLPSPQEMEQLPTKFTTLYRRIQEIIILCDYCGSVLLGHSSSHSVSSSSDEDSDGEFHDPRFQVGNLLGPQLMILVMPKFISNNMVPVRIHFCSTECSRRCELEILTKMCFTPADVSVEVMNSAHQALLPQGTRDPADSGTSGNRRSTSAMLCFPCRRRRRSHSIYLLTLP